MLLYSILRELYPQHGKQISKAEKLFNGKDDLWQIIEYANLTRFTQDKLGIKDGKNETIFNQDFNSNISRLA